ncbi:hypothetical protein BGZ83_006088 [Gryganskiella cystojenkinii]|nr:hypothetical protein BGZ83_006088 [Gryganskiella cystojenkinii]
MAEMIPDLTHYAQGLDSTTFPLKVSESREHDANHLSAQFTIVTKETLTAELALDGRGFKVLTVNRSSDYSAEKEPLNERQQKAVSGHVYETIEALLMALSPAFEEFFGQELIRKLSSTDSWDRFQREDSDSESIEEQSEDLGGHPPLPE